WMGGGAAGGPSPAPDYELSAGRLAEQTQFGAAARAPVRRVGLARFREADMRKAGVMQTPRWVIASTNDVGTTAPVPGAGATWTELRAEVALLNRRAAPG